MVEKLYIKGATSMKLTQCWLAVATIMVVATTYGMTQIDAEQAKQSVRSFEGNPNLELPEPKERFNPQAPVAKIFFEFTLPDGRSYWVDKETGWVFSADYAYASSRQGKPISEQQAIQIARNFLQHRSIIYQQYQTRMDVECKMLSKYYLIEFIEKIPNNSAYTYNQCIIKIEPYSGKVISFFQMWEKTPHPNRDRQPAVTAQEAANSVAAYFGFNMWDFLSTPKLLALPADWAPFNWNSSGLVWYVEIVGDRDIGRGGVLGFVDAMTGRILMTDVFLHRPSAFPRVKQPRICLEFTREKEGKIQAERFALRNIVPIVQFHEIFLPINIFERLGVKVTEKDNKVIIYIDKKTKFIDNFLKQNSQIYLPAKLLKELFPDKISSVQFYRHEWVRIYICNKQIFKLFEDLLEDLNSKSMNLGYKTKYHSFLDERESRLIAYVGLLITLCFLALLTVKHRKVIKVMR